MRAHQTCNFGPLVNCKPPTPNSRPQSNIWIQTPTTGRHGTRSKIRIPQISFWRFYPTPSVKLTIMLGQGPPQTKKVLKDEKASARTLRTCNFAPFRNCKPCTPNWKPFAKLPNSNANNGETRPKVGEYNPQVHFSIFYPTPSVKLTITWGQGTPNPKILPDALCEIGNYVGPGPPKTQKDKERLKNFGACTSNM